jgi:hypothetical protein
MLSIGGGGGSSVIYHHHSPFWWISLDFPLFLISKFHTIMFVTVDL